MLTESRLFFRLWLRNPLKIGAVAVSGPELAHAMARQIPQGPGHVVELGGGTGAVTRAILETGTAPGDLVVIERDPTLYKMLCDRFPDVRVIQGDAQQLQALLRRNGVGAVKAIVSGLPLLSMRKMVQDRITLQAFSVLPANAPLIQFTYGPLSPISRRRYGLQGQMCERILQNLPPASVWSYRKPALGDFGLSA